MKTIYILGRQPGLGFAELEALHGPGIIKLTGNVAAVDAPALARPVGSAVKTAQFLKTFPPEPWAVLNNKIIHYLKEVLPADAKVTLGLSIYGQKLEPKKIQNLAITLKKQRRQNNLPSLRAVPNQDAALSSAQVFHNKLTSSHKWEILVIFTSNKVILAKTTGVQNINAYAQRDRGRPRRDARVGMLPPKLAQTMINLGLEYFDTSRSDGELALPESKAFDSAKKRLSEAKVSEYSNHKTLLDPFCGTGVVLQEAALMGYDVYGTDKDERMIRYSQDNLVWLQNTHNIAFKQRLAQADATNAQWHQPIDGVVTETYLGRPFTTPPAPKLLEKTAAECNIIIEKFLQNLAPQLKTSTRLCVAVPAWFANNKTYHLKLLDDLRNIGYNRLDFKHASHDDLIYHREGQIVGRELLVLTRR